MFLEAVSQFISTPPLPRENTNSCAVVQEFQLHPDQRSAVVIFVHPVEARSFVKHVKNVRENGTGQEIRELQIEAAWYK